jgi:Zn-dependent metalloprotease
MALPRQSVCLAVVVAGLSVPLALAQAPSQASSQGIAPPAQTQPSLVGAMRDEASGSVTISHSDATAKVQFARVGLNGDLMPSVAGDSLTRATAKADRYLADFGAAFGAAKGQLTRRKVEADGFGGYTATYTQAYKGLPVFGSMIRAHVDSDGDLTSVNGYAAPDLDLSTEPGESASAAAARAVADVKSSPPEAEDGTPADTSGVEAEAPELLIYRTGAIKGAAGTNELAYTVEVGNGGAIREQVFVEANSGKLLNRYSLVDDALNRELREGTNPAPVWSEGDPFPGTLNAVQQNLMLTSQESYWFFKNVFARDSYDGLGAKRITVNNANIQCPNANWNGVSTNYCSGVTSDDVVAHEWGHAYTQFTWGGIYQWQTGALNESYSDIWGETLDLINNREDGGEGDLTTPRPVGACSTHSPLVPQVRINTPASIAQTCPAGGSTTFGPSLTATGPITGDVVVGTDVDEDGAGTVNTTTDGCSPLNNAASVAGKIAIVDRGQCGFTVKVKNAQNAGAVAVVVADNLVGPPAAMGGTDATITIPAVRITKSHGQLIKTALATQTVNVTLGDALKTDSYRWLIGEKTTAIGAGGALRDMWTPTCYGNPGKVSDVQYFCSATATSATDQGGVHSNSGVPNHGYALLVDGGTYNATTVTGIGLTKAAHIYYQAMANYQTPVTDFADHADALDTACADLIGQPLTNLSVATDDSTVSGQTITANDCAQVSAMAQAVELRQDPVQCGFAKLFNPATPTNGCGADTTKKTSLREDFEDGLTGWTLSGGILPWTASTSLPTGNKPAGSTKAAFAPDPNTTVCTGGGSTGTSSLTSPTITVGAADHVAGSALLSFDHSVALEPGYDGGQVQVAVNGGAPATVPAAAYTFNKPVVTLLSSGNTNPMAGQVAFNGSDGGSLSADWGTSIIDLSQLGVVNGDSIQVTFLLGRDVCGGMVGWWVDNVVVTTCRTITDATLAASHVAEPAAYGATHSILVTATGAAESPTGLVTVTEGATTLGTATLVAGAASIALSSAMPAGVHHLSVSYSGNDNYDVASTTLDATVTKGATTLAAVHVPEPVGFGQVHAVKVTATGAAEAPTGLVTVTEGATTLGTATLVAGAASIALSSAMPAGVHHLSVSYSGNDNYAVASTTLDATVGKVASATVGKATPSKVKKGKKVKTQVTVTAPGLTPTGSVQVTFKGQVVGVGTLAGGTATITLTKKLPVGKQTLVASYLGAADLLPSQGSFQVKIVKPRH